MCIHKVIAVYYNSLASGSLQISRPHHPGVQAMNLELLSFFSLAFTNHVTEVSRESPREGHGGVAQMPEAHRTQGLSRAELTSEASSLFKSLVR